jgi:hypothetical protein
MTQGTGASGPRSAGLGPATVGTSGTDHASTTTDNTPDAVLGGLVSNSPVPPGAGVGVLATAIAGARVTPVPEGSLTGTLTDTDVESGIAGVAMKGLQVSTAMPAGGHTSTPPLIQPHASSKTGSSVPSASPPTGLSSDAEAGVGGSGSVSASESQAGFTPTGPGSAGSNSISGRPPRRGPNTTTTTATATGTGSARVRVRHGHTTSFGSTGTPGTGTPPREGDGSVVDSAASGTPAIAETSREGEAEAESDSGAVAGSEAEGTGTGSGRPKRGSGGSKGSRGGSALSWRSDPAVVAARSQAAPVTSLTASRLGHLLVRPLVAVLLPLVPLARVQLSRWS